MRLPVLQRWRETEAARAREADAARRAREAVDTAERAARENITNPLGMRFRLIPAGEFLMGSPASEAGRDDDETQHRVRITRPFYMGVTEVTQAQWEAVMRSDPSGFKGADLSVDRVSWDDCQEFIRRLNAREAGVTYRLPTEAEWEYACRAGTTTRYGFGDDEARLGEYAWYFANGGRTYPVGQKRANGWGLFDMHGNVWEWCQDWYAETYGSGEQVDPAGPGSEDGRRVLRGGSWSNNVGDLRSARRYGSAPSNRLYGCGFRLARSS
ncbi:MAG: formylglycine-generating enzyme family protein [Planctomycetes bacterium]|nr:formylglycine-generating enzyme family protein [Planctomycetota bacterium]